MSKKKTELPPPLTIGGKIVRDGMPDICCHMLDYVLAQEKPQSRTGLFRPFAILEHVENNRLKPRNVIKDVLYRATGRKAQNVFLNFCPFCGTSLKVEPDGKATKANDRRRSARTRQLQAG
jgi:hypothetical protein